MSNRRLSRLTWQRMDLAPNTLRSRCRYRRNSSRRDRRDLPLRVPIASAAANGYLADLRTRRTIHPSRCAAAHAGAGDRARGALGEERTARPVQVEPCDLAVGEFR